jgi:hypothetical protein
MAARRHHAKHADLPQLLDNIGWNAAQVSISSARADGRCQLAYPGNQRITHSMLLISLRWLKLGRGLSDDILFSYALTGHLG